MKKSIIFIIIVPVILILSCASVNFQGIQVVKSMTNFIIINNFERKISDQGIGFLGFKFLPFGQPDEEIFTAIKEEIEKLDGDAAVNVEIEYGMSFFDLLFHAVSATIYKGNTITIRGTVIRYGD